MTPAATPEIGHNNPPEKIDKGLIQNVVERIEALEDDKRTLQIDIKEVYAEAKGHGLKVKALREVIKRRRQDRADIEEFEDTVLAYEDILT